MLSLGPLRCGHAPGLVFDLPVEGEVDGDAEVMETILGQTQCNTPAPSPALIQCKHPQSGEIAFTGFSHQGLQQKLESLQSLKVKQFVQDKLAEIYKQAEMLG